MSNLVNVNVRINREARAALVAFRRSKPWRGSVEERRVKFEALAAGLAGAYGLAVPELRLVLIDAEPETLGNGAYSPAANAIVLVRKLSVVTLLHCFARARGMTRQEAFRWSLSVFAKMFPVSFARCELRGCILVRK